MIRGASVVEQSAIGGKEPTVPMRVGSPIGSHSKLIAPHLNNAAKMLVVTATEGLVKPRLSNHRERGLQIIGLTSVYLINFLGAESLLAGETELNALLRHVIKHTNETNIATTRVKKPVDEKPVVIHIVNIHTFAPAQRLPAHTLNHAS